MTSLVACQGDRPNSLVATPWTRQKRASLDSVFEENGRVIEPAKCVSKCVYSC